MALTIDLTGQRFERLIVLRRALGGGARTTWVCSCDCGAEKIAATELLRSGRTRSCGCLKRERTTAFNATKKVDLTGRRFGRLVAVSAGPVKNGKHFWNCRCECGTEKLIPRSQLQGRNTFSCGCLIREKTRARLYRHGATSADNGRTASGARKSSPTYKSWRGMAERCYNVKCKDFLKYGGRGIEVCERWLESFENFVADMGERPVNCSIDRIDNNGNYEPSNCRWATPAEQCRNRRSTVYVILDGENVPLPEACERYGQKLQLACRRIAMGWDAISALTLPSLGVGKRRHIT